MKKLILASTLLLVATQIQAQNNLGQVVITPSGNYVVSQSGSTTYVTGPNTSTGSAIAIAAPVNVNPVTGIGQVITPSGSYLVQRSGSTTTVIQTSKSR